MENGNISIRFVLYVKSSLQQVVICLLLELLSHTYNRLPFELYEQSCPRLSTYNFRVMILKYDVGWGTFIIQLYTLTATAKLNYGRPYCYCCLEKNVQFTISDTCLLLRTGDFMWIEKKGKFKAAAKNKYFLSLSITTSVRQFGIINFTANESLSSCQSIVIFRLFIIP